jgi:nicotinic acid phosphoribosyltransferase
MVVAVKGEKKIKVSKNAYDNIYKKAGYRIEETKENSKPVELQEANHETEGDEAEDIDSIPISEMSKKQLMEYAKKYDIDTSEAKNVTEARRIIQKAVRESKE